MNFRKSRIIEGKPEIPVRNQMFPLPQYSITIPTARRRPRNNVELTRLLVFRQHFINCKGYFLDVRVKADSASSGNLGFVTSPFWIGSHVTGIQNGARSDLTNPRSRTEPEASPLPLSCPKSNFCYFCQQRELLIIKLTGNMIHRKFRSRRDHLLWLQ